MLERAKTILTPEQHLSFGAFQTNQLEFQKLSIKMTRNMLAPVVPLAP